MFDWERNWRGSGIFFVVLYVACWIIYGSQPKVGSSAAELVSFYDGDRTRILIAATLLALNVLNLRTPESAILSAVIFNALVIVALIPVALRGVRYRPTTAAALLRRNVLIYGVGGVIAPFVGIKLIDILLSVVGY